MLLPPTELTLAEAFIHGDFEIEYEHFAWHGSVMPARQA